MNPSRVRELKALFEKSKTSNSHQRFIALISMVPKGRVASYGQIAKLAECPGHARQVVRTLHSSSKKYKLPWQRIMNSQGKIGLTDEVSYLKQKSLLYREGVSVDLYDRIDFQVYLWKPKKSEIQSLFKKLKLD